MATRGGGGPSVNRGGRGGASGAPSQGPARAVVAASPSAAPGVAAPSPAAARSSSGGGAHLVAGSGSPSFGSSSPSPSASSSSSPAVSTLKPSASASDLSRGAPLNAYSSIREYVFRVLSHVPGMKSLLLDSCTSKMVSMVLSQSEILRREVYLMENIDAALVIDDDEEAKQSLHHMKACLFVRPTGTTLANLTKFLKSPRYKEYYIFFTNICPAGYLDSVAAADERCYVKHVAEYYGDFYAISPTIFHADASMRKISKNIVYEHSPPQAKQTALSQRDVQCVLSLLLAFKKKPDIRFHAGSEAARKLAQQLVYTFNEENDLFYFPGSGSGGGGSVSPAVASGRQSLTAAAAAAAANDTDTLLLIVDRRDDPVTPLLLQWTYHAMIHELLGGVDYNRLDLAAISNSEYTAATADEMRQWVVSTEVDDFFKSIQFASYGEVGPRVKSQVANFQKIHKTQSKLDTLEDIQKVLETMPEFKKEASTVSRHVAVTSSLTRLVSSRSLMKCSALEQELVCGPPDHTNALTQLMALIDLPSIDWMDKLRVGLLYALRYEQHKENQITAVRNKIRDTAALTDQEKQKVVILFDELPRYAGAKVRKTELFSDMSIRGIFKNVVTTIKGIDSIYTQHKPLLADVLEQALKNELRSVSYPHMEGSAPAPKSLRYRNILVYVIGGATLEEAVHCDLLAQKNNVRIVLGGSCIHNSTTFLNELLPDEMFAGDVAVEVPVHAVQAAVAAKQGQITRSGLSSSSAPR